MLSVIINNKLSWLPYTEMFSCHACLKRQFLQINLRTDLLLNMHLQLGIITKKMSFKRLKVFTKKKKKKKKAARFILNDYNRNSSVSKMIKKLNLDTTELSCKVIKN